MEWSTVQTDWGAMQQQILTRWPELEETEVSAVDGNRAVRDGGSARQHGHDAAANQEIDRAGFGGRVGCGCWHHLSGICSGSGPNWGSSVPPRTAAIEA